MPVVTTNLVYYWNGKDGIKTGNTLRNIAPNGTTKNMEITGGKTLANGAIALNGTTDFAKFPATESMFTTSASPYTMEMVYTPRVFSGDHAIWEGGLFFGTFTWGKLYWEFSRNPSGNVSGQVNTVAAMNTASPMRMAVVYNGTNAQIYINGSLVGTVAAGSTHAFSASGFTTVSIAGGVSGIANYMIDLHAVRIYNRALTSSELTTNWNEGIEIGLVIADTTPPAEVPTLTESHSHNSITLNWTKPSDTDFSHVRILRDGVQIATNQTGLSYTDSGKNPETTYTYLVKTVDGLGNESIGKSITIKTSPPPDVTPPANPTNLAATPSYNTVILNWVNPTDPDFFFISLERNGVEVATNLRGESYEDTNLLPSTNYTYSLYAVDMNSNSASGTSITVQTSPMPDFTAPSVRITGVDRFKISDETGMNEAKVRFTFDKDVTEWRVRVMGVDPFTGIFADAGGELKADTEIEAIISWDELYQEGNNRINIYGRSINGVWTSYEDSLFVDGGSFFDVIFDDIYNGGSFLSIKPNRIIDGGYF